MIGQLLHGHSVNAFRLPDPVVHLHKDTREKESAQQNTNYSLNVGAAVVNINSVKFFWYYCWRFRQSAVQCSRVAVSEFLCLHPSQTCRNTGECAQLRRNLQPNRITLIVLKY